MKNIFSFYVVFLFVHINFSFSQGLTVGQEDANGYFARFGELGSPLHPSFNLKLGSNRIQTMRSGIFTFPQTFPTLKLNPLGGNIGIGQGQHLGKLTINHDSNSSSPSLLLLSNGLFNFNTSIIEFNNNGHYQNYQMEYTAVTSDTAVLFAINYRPSENNIFSILHHWPSLKEVSLNSKFNNDTRITYTGELRVGVQKGGQPFNMQNNLKLESTSNEWYLSFGSHIAFVYDGVWVATIDEVGEYFSFSDARLKTDIERLENVLPNLLKIEPLSYHFRSSNKTEKSIGLIAQDLLEIIPEAVDYNQENDLYAISYKDINVLLVKAIQERQQTISVMKTNLEKQKIKYNYLASHIALLERQ